MIREWFELAENIKKMYGSEGAIALHEPTFDGKEMEYVNDCIQSGWVSSVGKYVIDFEKQLASYAGVKRAIAVVNGTAALHIALKIAGVKEQDEVLMPALTFIATANAVSYLGAVPHFVDVSTLTLGIDPDKLEKHIIQIGKFKDGHLVNRLTGRIIRAVVPMHTFGHPVDMDPLLDICNRYGLVIIEDAAESLGSFYKGKHTGGFGLAGALSFNGNKIITTGGGGAILTNDEQLADHAKHLTTTAKIPHKWDYRHDEIAYNYRMPNINAALGCAQLERLPYFLEKKKNLVKKYQEILKPIKGVRLLTEPESSSSNYWLQTIILDEDSYNRDDVLEILLKNGVQARPVWTPLDGLSPYSGCPKDDLSNTYLLNRQIINIPSTPLKGEHNVKT
ncbi:MULTISPECIES: LegC family aminotransferase [Paenibacillus]|uniref:Perosamine synthetase n=1 Tax=Paenibacillus pabuli TaxID=1472 RepID=A0A855Y6A9_9BACL|nr:MULTISPECIES: LegC family aminotransferase [Paenibacillus]PWW37444.1 perosamine synthetase [Paenibacillus pabuli]PXW05586.1 perosamine synthetase [Paenibacillus taichungensis]RAI98878.1 perosamine synthetase [Paenibacillus pabuli]